VVDTKDKFIAEVVDTTNNLPPVSTTSNTFIAGVVDTSDKFTTGVNHQ
jgi:hypothetical protein